MTTKTKQAAKLYAIFDDFNGEFITSPMEMNELKQQLDDDCIDIDAESAAEYIIYEVKPTTKTVSVKCIIRG